MLEAVKSNNKVLKVEHRAQYQFGTFAITWGIRRCGAWLQLASVHMGFMNNYSYQAHASRCPHVETHVVQHMTGNIRAL